MKMEKISKREMVLSLFKNDLTDRQQYVYIDGVSSTYRTTTCGVSQGTVLGPILFPIYNLYL